MITKEELKFASIVPGALCVTITGVQKKPMSCVTNLNFYLEVRA